MRFSAFLFVLSLWCGLGSQLLGQSALERVWRDSSGKFAVKAKLESITPKGIYLRSEDGRKLPVARSILSSADNEFLTAVDAIEESHRQFELVVPHVERMVTSPGAVLEILEQLHDEIPSGLAAGLFCSCIHAAEGGRAGLEKGEKILDQTILRLRTIQKEFPEAHRQTLISAFNNRAVMHLRDRNANQAVSFFARAAELSDEIPFVVYHNATILLEVSSQPSTVLDLDRRSRGELVGLLAKNKPEGPGTTVPRRFMYSIAHDVFDSISDGDNSDAAVDAVVEPVQIKPLEPGFVLSGFGSGFLIAPKLILTNRHVVDGYESGLRFRIRNESDVSKGILAAVRKVSSVKEADLALLELNEPLVGRALPLRGTPVQIGENLTVLGYPNPEEFEQTLTVSSGIVNKFMSGGMVLMHDAATNGGNSGGPCVDDNGNAIGVHFGKASINTVVDGGYVVGGNMRNQAVSVTEVLKFLADVAEYEPVTNFVGSSSRPEMIARAKQSVFSVEVWAAEQQVRKSAVSGISRSNDPLVAVRLFNLWPELTCFACQGTGVRDCLKCVGGIVSVNKREAIGVSPLTGKPVIGNQVYREKCAVCSGAGGFKCPMCNGGRLSLD